MLHRASLVRIDVSGESIATIIRVASEMFLRSVLGLPVSANVGPSSPILVTMIMEAIFSSKILVLTRATRRKVTEDGILQNTSSNEMRVFYK
jgi:hypothetical protein